MFVKLLGVLLVAALVAAIAARGSAGGGHPVVYVVQAHDTLWSIASAHYAGDTREGVWKIEHRNHIADDVISVGERLVLPP